MQRVEIPSINKAWRCCLQARLSEFQQLFRNQILVRVSLAIGKLAQGRPTDCGGPTSLLAEGIHLRASSVAVFSDVRSDDLVERHTRAGFLGCRRTFISS